MPDIVRVEHLSYIYGQGMPDATVALDDISFSIEEGSFVGRHWLYRLRQKHPHRPF